MLSDLWTLLSVKWKTRSLSQRREQLGRVQGLQQVRGTDRYRVCILGRGAGARPPFPEALVLLLGVQQGWLSRDEGRRGRHQERRGQVRCHCGVRGTGYGERIVICPRSEDVTTSIRYHRDPGK